MAREDINGISVPIPDTGEPADFVSDLRRIASDLPASIAARNPAVTTLRGLPLMAVPPTLTLTKTATVSASILAPLTITAADPAFLFTGNGPGTAVSGAITYTKHATGSATAATWEWWSDAAQFDIRLNGSNLKASLFVDGELASSADIITDASGQPYTLHVDFGGVAKPRRYRLSGVNALFGGVVLPGDRSAWAPVAATPFVWALTDSYGFGTGASPLVQSAAVVAGHNLGAELLTDGIGGTGWIEGGGGTLPSPQSRVTSKLAALNRAPAEIWFMLGYNNALSDLAAVATGINESVALARAAWPAVPIRLFGPATPLGLTSQLTAVHNVIAARARALGCHFTSLAGIVTAANSAHYTGADSQHPNQVGHIFLGQREALRVKPTFLSAEPAPIDYGLNDYDHLWPLRELGLKDGATFSRWADLSPSPDYLTELGTGGGSFGTSVYVAAEGGYVRFTSTSGNGKVAATSALFTRPRTMIIVARMTSGGSAARVGGTLLARAGGGAYTLTASGTGSGGQQIVSSVTADGFKVFIITATDSSASIFVNGVKGTPGGAWVPGAITTARIQATDTYPTDFKFVATVNRVISDGEAASITAALQVVYPEAV